MLELYPNESALLHYMGMLILCHFQNYLLLLVAKHKFAGFKLSVSSHFYPRKR